jgi:hypothetical protein
MFEARARVGENSPVSDIHRQYHQKLGSLPGPYRRPKLNDHKLDKGIAEVGTSSQSCSVSRRSQSTGGHQKVRVAP